MELIKFSFSNLTNRKKADLLVVPFLEDKNVAKSATDIKNVLSMLSHPLKTGDFKGKKGELSLIYQDSSKEKRLLMLGLGKKKEMSGENIRQAYGKVISFCKCKKLTSINILLPQSTGISEAELVTSICEGLLITNYSFHKYKSKSEKAKCPPIKTAGFIGASEKGKNAAARISKVMDGVYLTRDIVNDNADEITPQFLANLARKMNKKYPFKTTIFDKKRIQKEKMGLLLSVSQGAACDPAFIIMKYEGNPKSKDHSVIVGKGITFDSGGLNLKPSGFIETMRSDMAGAASIFGTMQAIANLKLKINVTGVVPAAENIIGSKSYKPGDVHMSYSGKTVEIGNTDAEGRLILADAISYTSKNLKPSRIIDLATLTGAIVIALGFEITGMMTDDEKISNALIKAGEKTHEKVWRLPLYKNYRDLLNSNIADIRNVSGDAKGRGAGSITAALFLKEFVGKDIPWAHLDIAGSSFSPKPIRYYSQGATGIGVRLLVDFLENL